MRVAIDVANCGLLLKYFYIQADEKGKIIIRKYPFDRLRDLSKFVELAETNAKPPTTNH